MSSAALGVGFRAAVRGGVTGDERIVGVERKLEKGRVSQGRRAGFTRLCRPEAYTTKRQKMAKDRQANCVRLRRPEARVTGDERIVGVERKLEKGRTAFAFVGRRPTPPNGRKRKLETGRFVE